MKKCIALILSLIYLSASSGMVMNVQYCFEKVASIKIDGIGEDKWCCTNSSKKSDCCSNELMGVKVDASHAPASTDFNLEAPVQFYNSSTSYSLSPVLLSDVEPLQSSDNSPPFAAATPIYIKNCVFRI
jgi:hypothetical protein